MDKLKGPCNEQLLAILYGLEKLSLFNRLGLVSISSTNFDKQDDNYWKLITTNIRSIIMSIKSIMRDY